MGEAGHVVRSPPCGIMGPARARLGASRCPCKRGMVIDRQSGAAGVGVRLAGGGHVATAAATAITFPGGRGWVAKPKMSALISVQLGLVSQRCSCLPSAESTHSYRDMGVLCARTRTRMLTHAHTQTPTLFILFRYHLPHSLASTGTHAHTVYSL